LSRGKSVDDILIVPGAVRNVDLMQNGVGARHSKKSEGRWLSWETEVKGSIGYS
jgi:hypothetical protein